MQNSSSKVHEKFMREQIYSSRSEEPAEITERLAVRNPVTGKSVLFDSTKPVRKQLGKAPFHGSWV